MAAENNVDFLGLSKQDILDRFEEMETKYKTEGTPEGYQNVLNIFNFTSRGDMVPQNVCTTPIWPTGRRIVSYDSTSRRITISPMTKRTISRTGSPDSRSVFFTVEIPCSPS